MSEDKTFRRVVRSVEGGWWAEAGWVGWQPYRKFRFTKPGASWAARRMEWRLRRGGE